MNSISQMKDYGVHVILLVSCRKRNANKKMKQTQLSQIGWLSSTKQSESSVAVFVFIISIFTDIYGCILQ